MMRSWIDLRAIGLAALLAFAAALPRITTSVELRDYFFFDATLTSTSVGSTQFFWDLGKGFTEFDSSRQPIRIEPKPVVYRFMMPMGRFKALRFDPIDGAGVFTLSHAQVVDLKGHVMKRFAPADLVPENGIIRATPRGDELEVVTDPASNDPVLSLRLKEPLVLEPGFRIWFRQGWPTALTVFLLGVLLSLPPIAARLSRLAAGIGARARSRPTLTIMLVAALTVAIECHPVLFQGRSFVSPNNGGHMLYDGLPTLPGYDDPMSTNTGSSDTGALLFQHLYYPMVQRDALAAGELPLWNRYSLSGEPLLGQGQSMFGDPFNFLTIFADGAAWAWDVRFLLARWLLAAALGGIVWQLGRHLGAAALTTVGAGFLGFFSFRLVHPANFSVAYAPLILLAWTGLQVAPTPRRLAAWTVALMAANWVVFTSGTIKEAYMLLLGMNFAGVLLLFLRPETAGRRGFLFGTASAAGFGFILLSAPGWVSFLSAWHHSVTGYDIPQVNTLPWTQVIGFFDDIFYRQTFKDENVVAPALNFLFFAGVLWWFVQPAAARTSRAGFALVLAGIPALLLAFGLVPAALILRLPFVGNIVHVGNTFSCVLLGLMAVLAGLGFGDAWRQLGQPATRRVVFRYALAVAGVAALYFWTTRGQPKSPFFLGYATALLVAVVVLPLGLQWGSGPASPRGALWVVLLIGGPLLVWRHGQYASSQFDHYVFVPGPRVDLHAPSPAVALLAAQKKETGRIAGWDSNLYASYNTLLRWEGVYGVDAVRSRHYQELAEALELRRIWDWDWPNREAQARDLVRKYDLYNVTHWLATHRDGSHPIDGLALVGQADLDVYASPTAWPRAFFTDRVTGYDTPADFARLLHDGDGRPFAAVQSSAAEGHPAALTLSPPGAARTIRPAHDYQLAPNRTTFTVEAPAAGVAVLAETYYLDDFEVTVNGRPADYFRVNHTFKGVALPGPGTYEISFRYWPEHLTAALGAALAGLVLVAGGLFWLARRPALPASQSVSA